MSKSVYLAHLIATKRLQKHNKCDSFKVVPLLNSNQVKTQPNKFNLIQSHQVFLNKVQHSNSRHSKQLPMRRGQAVSERDERALQVRQVHQLQVPRMIYKTRKLLGRNLQFKLKEVRIFNNYG